MAPLVMIARADPFPRRASGRMTEDVNGRDWRGERVRVPVSGSALRFRVPRKLPAPLKVTFLSSAIVNGEEGKVGGGSVGSVQRWSVVQRLTILGQCQRANGEI